ncbi:uncharacterized protein [Salminus brasiliensis]|uniref:uncharacterized protein n=1 Tax=Salminus brasiliensis TaxID=930266 RepID=UPI003B8373A2
MDRDILLEALSTLTGARVKPYTELQARTVAGPQTLRGGIVRQNELTIDNYLTTIFGVGYGPLVSGQVLKSVCTPAEKELFVNMEQLFDQQFDYDFRSGSDSSRPSRGGESYSRPWGWYRCALRVLNKYPGGNAWLGSPGWREESSPGEWPVSFHGTSIEGAKGIPGSHYKPGPGQVYGRGIYSTPDICEAIQYAKNFTFRNKTYRVIMQNRINPQNRVQTSRKDYWLISIPEGTSPAKEKEIVEASIRPYGILIKEM